MKSVELDYVFGEESKNKKMNVSVSSIMNERNNIQYMDPLNDNNNSLPYYNLNEEKEYLKEPLNLTFNETKKNNTLVMFENDLWLEGRENLYKSYENIYLILLTNADRKIELDEKVLAFKKKALSDVQTYLDKSSLESPERLQQQKSFDVVYPSVGENLDYLREVQKINNTDINFITREEDIFCWEFSNKGFFNFKKNIPDILKKFS